MKLLLLVTFLLSTKALFANQDLYDKDIEDILSASSEVKADVGSRSGSQNYLKSNTPVDIITSEQIERSGLSSLVDVLRYFVAGFNAPETSIADGSDHVRAYTLRGMSPDQLLVLINGKRLHTSALLHVNGVIGRGTSHVDLDTIILSAIERVEILRDGAAAQYGSDAISGVINIVLKGLGHRQKISIHAGKRKEGDGTLLQTDTFLSMPLDYDGYFNLALEAKNQEQTQRAGEDNRLTPPSVQTHVGIPDSQNFKAMLNAEVAQISDTVFYAQGLFNYRDSKASAFFRPSNDKSMPKYENGFLPIIEAKIYDYSACVGIKGEFSNGTSWDFSNTLGKNNFHYYVHDSMNYSMAQESPASFDNGSLSFLQNTALFDLKKSYKNFSIAGGVEYRYENYSIKAGESASYFKTGSQGFAGYALENEIDESRQSYAFYVDNLYDFTEDFQFETALRYENYSDFGDTTNGKIALKYSLNKNLVLRSSASTGFRAPSLTQKGYSQTSSFVNAQGNLSTQGTFRVDHEIATMMGAKDLTSEKSKHFTLGGIYKSSEDIVISFDYFYIDVQDKIVLTPELSPRTQEQKDIFKKYNVSAARCFTNAQSTNTQGIDIKIEHKYHLLNKSELDMSLWYSYNINTVNQNNNKINSAEKLEIVTMLEEGQPRDSLRFLAHYLYEKISVTLNISRYGEYMQARDMKKYKFDAAWLSDFDVTYKLNNALKVSIGAINIFDTLPNKWDGLSGDFYGENGIKPYSRYSPFGYSGAYYYLRASVEF